MWGRKPTAIHLPGSLWTRQVLDVFRWERPQAYPAERAHHPWQDSLRELPVQARFGSSDSVQSCAALQWWRGTSDVRCAQDFRCHSPCLALGSPPRAPCAPDTTLEFARDNPKLEKVRQ